MLARQLERAGLAGAIVVTEADPRGRDLLRRSAERAVSAAGLDELLVDARHRFRDWVEQSLNLTRSDLKVVHYAVGPALGPVADRIAVIEAGQMTELGTHQALLAHAGTYARLFNLQAEGYR